MKTLDVLTKAQVKEEYHLKESYLKRHARELGGYGKPMIFDRELVELHLREKIWKDRLATEARAEKVKEIKRRLDATIERVKAQHRVNAA